MTFRLFVAFAALPLPLGYIGLKVILWSNSTSAILRTKAVNHPSNGHTDKLVHLSVQVQYGL